MRTRKTAALGTDFLAEKEGEKEGVEPGAQGFECCEGMEGGGEGLFCWTISRWSFGQIVSVEYHYINSTSNYTPMS